MKKYLFLILLFTAIFYSCKQDNCNIKNYDKIKWEKIDSITTYIICNNSNKEIKKDDLVTIDFLGELTNNKIVKVKGEEILIEQITKINFGTFNYGNSSLSNEFKELIKPLKANSSMTLKYDFGKFYSPNYANKIDVFFKQNTDSIDHIKWINEIKNKIFVDSVSYITKEIAISRYNDVNDTTWKNFIDANPLPSSVEIYLKQDYLDSTKYYNVCEELKKGKVVNEVLSLNSTLRETMRKVDLIMKKTFLIRIKS